MEAAIWVQVVSCCSVAAQPVKRSCSKHTVMPVWLRWQQGHPWIFTAALVCPVKWINPIQRRTAAYLSTVDPILRSYFALPRRPKFSWTTPVFKQYPPYSASRPTLWLTENVQLQGRITFISHIPCIHTTFRFVRRKCRCVFHSLLVAVCTWISNASSFTFSYWCNYWNSSCRPTMQGWINTACVPYTGLYSGFLSSVFLYTASGQGMLLV